MSEVVDVAMASSTIANHVRLLRWGVRSSKIALHIKNSNEFKGEVFVGFFENSTEALTTAKCILDSGNHKVSIEEILTKQTCQLISSTSQHNRPSLVLDVLVKKYTKLYRQVNDKTMYNAYYIERNILYNTHHLTKIFLGAVNNIQIAYNYVRCILNCQTLHHKQQIIQQIQYELKTKKKSEFPHEYSDFFDELVSPSQSTIQSSTSVLSVLHEIQSSIQQMNTSIESMKVQPVPMNIVESSCIEMNTMNSSTASIQVQDKFEYAVLQTSNYDDDNDEEDDFLWSTQPSVNTDCSSISISHTDNIQIANHWNTFISSTPYDTYNSLPTKTLEVNIDSTISPVYHGSINLPTSSTANEVVSNTNNMQVSTHLSTTATSTAATTTTATATTTSTAVTATTATATATSIPSPIIPILPKIKKKAPNIKLENDVKERTKIVPFTYGDTDLLFKLYYRYGTSERFIGIISDPTVGYDLIEQIVNSKHEKTKKCREIKEQLLLLNYGKTNVSSEITEITEITEIAEIAEEGSAVVSSSGGPLHHDLCVLPSIPEQPTNNNSGIENSSEIAVSDTVM